VDDASGEPVRVKARLTPGRKPPSATPLLSGGGGLLQSVLEAVRPRPIPWNERTYWDNNRVSDSVDGRFSFPFRPLTSTPMLRVEADGYHPLETGPMPKSDTNLTLRLKKGSGPKGVLLGTNGQPAAGITVLFGGDQEQFSLDESGTLSAYGADRSKVVTGPDGAFAFPSKPNGRRVFAADPSGWASVMIKDWPADGRVRLEPWAQVSGVLTEDDGKPASNIQLAIESARFYQEGDSWVNFQERPMTDALGRFGFKRVPPGEVRLSYLIPMNNSGWMHAAQTNLTAQSGKPLDLGPMKKAPHPHRF